MIRALTHARRTRWRLVAACASLLIGAGCEAEPAAPESLVPADLTGFTEERDCRASHEHELRYIRVLAGDKSREPYRRLDGSVPYPVGSLLIKAEYDDSNCQQLIGYTAIQKEPAGYWKEGHDWRWQKLDSERGVLQDGRLQTCVTCHDHHCTPGLCDYEGCGYDLTCGEEL